MTASIKTKPVILILSLLLMAVLSSCGDTIIQQCAGGMDQPLHFLVYDNTLGSKHTNHPGPLILDTARINISIEKEASIVWDQTVIADYYFTSLARDGYGSWDGCYGGRSTERILSFWIHTPHDDAGKYQCYWQSGSVSALTLLSDDCLTPTAISHEVTHAFVERVLTLRPDDGESGAITEALGDIFAVIIANPVSYIVDLQSGPKRNLAGPASDEYVINIADFHPDNNKYKSSGIFSYAAYLAMEQLGRDKFGKILFHALSPAYVTHLTPEKHKYEGQYTFEEMATGVLAACNDLAGRGMGEITAPDCKQVRLAFQAVGILTEQPTPVPPSPIEKVSGGHWSTIVNQSNQTITIHDANCDKGTASYSVRWQDNDITTGQSSRFELDLRSCPAVTFEIAPQQGKTITIQVAYDPNYTYRITVTDADFK